MGYFCKGQWHSQACTYFPSSADSAGSGMSAACQTGESPETCCMGNFLRAPELKDAQSCAFLMFARGTSSRWTSMSKHGRTWRLTDADGGMSSTLAWPGLKASSGRLRRRNAHVGRIASLHLHLTAPSPAPPVAESSSPASVCTATADNAPTRVQIHDLPRSTDAMMMFARVTVS